MIPTKGNLCIFPLFPPTHPDTGWHISLAAQYACFLQRKTFLQHMFSPEGWKPCRAEMLLNSPVFQTPVSAAGSNSRTNPTHLNLSPHCSPRVKRDTELLSTLFKRYTTTTTKKICFPLVNGALVLKEMIHYVCTAVWKKHIKAQREYRRGQNGTKLYRQTQYFRTDYEGK